VQAVADDLTAGDRGVATDPRPTSPTDIARSLPALRAAFLVLLAVGAVAHALLAGVRGRRRDLAVLRALGLTPGQAAACVLWQAAIIAAVALVVGVPLGLAIGRQMWRVLADSLSFVYVAPIAGLVLALVPIVLR
jgi:ABC-type lipoprotein release transport system permease subunit